MDEAIAHVSGRTNRPIHLSFDIGVCTLCMRQFQRKPRLFCYNIAMRLGREPNLNSLLCLFVSLLLFVLNFSCFWRTRFVSASN